MALSWTSARIAALLLSTTFVLSACDSAEERAQEHFESGLALLEEGDVARALVEFRNVFQLNPQHTEARLVFARTLKEQGALNQAYAQYLRVAEQAPDTIEAQIELAEMAIISRNWEEVERHGRAAEELAPQDTRVKIIVTALNYAEAQREENVIAGAEEAATARALLDEKPDSLIARQIAIDSDMRNGDLTAALQQIDAGLEYAPDNYGLHAAKLGIFLQQQDMDAVGEALKTMVARFPGNQDLEQNLISFYIQRQDLDSAEAFLRELAVAPDAGQTEKLTVVRFLRDARGPDVAREEVERLVAENPENVSYRALMASLDFEAGEQDSAIADLEALVSTEDGEMSEDIGNAKLILARMLQGTGNSVGARAQIEEIIENDPTHVEALKMRAVWLIEEDNPDAAILDLRTALSEAPRDANIMTLMARAHERAGSRDLAGERYALAVEVSMQAPAESLRYAEFLLQDNRADAATAVLTEALTRSPNHLGLLQSLARLKLADEQWNEVTRIIWRLRSLEDERATVVANGLEADVMLRQERLDETIEFLEGLAQEGGDNKDAALAALIQTKVRAGQLDEAAAMLQQRLDADPDSAFLRFLRAGLYMIEGDRDAAAEIYEDLLEQFPGNPRMMRVLNSIMIARGDGAEAAAMIDEQIEKAPNPAAAKLLKAERLEREKDFDGAIAIYEELYALNSGNIVVANNLASLITTHRDDEADLDRAYAIARRLRGIDNPALQDTYGWIAYRLGNYDEAVEYLEKSAKGLPQEPLVQYHLGMTYHALNRTEDAKAALTLALELAGDDPLPQYDRARSVLSEIGE